MVAKGPKILYFIDGPVPNTTNHREANALRHNGAQVMFRNAKHDDGSLEECAGVAGPAIPERYKKLPSVDEALAKHEADVTKAESEAAAKVEAAGGFDDNLGTHTLPNPGQVPVAAPVRHDQPPALTGKGSKTQPASKPAAPPPPFVPPPSDPTVPPAPVGAAVANPFTQNQ